MSEMESKNITKNLARDIAEIKTLSAKDIEQLQLLILDFFAAAFAGYRQNEDFNSSVERIVFPRGGAEESYVLFQDIKYPAGTAAFMNSIYGHGAELDDGNKKAAGHAGVHLIPAVFALADRLGSSNEDVLIALASGYEAFIRISSAAQPGLIKRGFHSTGMAGTPGVAAACARLLHLDDGGIEDAVSLATTMSGGLLSYGDSRPAIKPINPGKAAECGLFAAMMASEGIKGPTEALEGRNGWFNAVTDSIDEEALTASDHLLIHDCYFKLYPSCRHTHCGIDAAIKLHEKIEFEDITAINVMIYPAAIKLAGIKYPKNSDETKFSIYYTIAKALLKGSYELSDMNIEGVTPEVVSIIDKINIISDPTKEDRKRGIRGTKIEIIDANGNAFEEEVLVPKGDPENPVDKKVIAQKFRECAGSLIDEEKQNEILNSISQIQGKDSFVNPIRYTTDC